MSTQNRPVHQLDASSQPPGRLASEIARILQGKHRPDYQAHQDMGDTVEVVNCDKMSITGRNKPVQKTYYKHSQYKGGLRAESLKQLLARDPGEVLRRAVMRMLPKNRLQDARIKRLIIK